MSSLIIRDKGVVAEENYNLEKKVKKAVKDSIQKECEHNFKIYKAGLGPEQHEQNTAARMLAKRAQKDVEREIPKVAKDGIIGKVRRFIPSEILVAWGFIKEGFKMVADDELNSLRFTIIFSVTWTLLLVCVFGYVYFNLRRDLQKEKKRDNALTLSKVEMAAHATVSVVSFALLSITEGPALRVWNTPSYIVHLTTQRFGNTALGSIEKRSLRLKRSDPSYIPAILFGFFLIIQGTFSSPYRSAEHIEELDARRRAEEQEDSDNEYEGADGNVSVNQDNAAAL